MFPKIRLLSPAFLCRASLNPEGEQTPHLVRIEHAFFLLDVALGDLDVVEIDVIQLRERIDAPDVALALGLHHGMDRA